MSSTLEAVVDLSGPTKQHWLSKAGNILQRWTVPVKVKKEKKESQHTSKVEHTEVVAID